MPEVADQRVHGTTGEAPIERFRRGEANALRSLAGIPPFEMARELVRKVQADCVIGVDGNAYSVPWRLIGESVRVVIVGDQLRISHAGREVAVHQRQASRFMRVVDPVHFDGVVGSRSKAPLTTVPVCEAVGAVSYCVRCSNTSGRSEGAGDGARPSDRDAEPAQTDSDPRSARQLDRRSRPPRADHSGGAIAVL